MGKAYLRVWVSGELSFEPQGEVMNMIYIVGLWNAWRGDYLCAECWKKACVILAILDLAAIDFTRILLPF
jgi:hypothetical protein